MLDWLAAMLAEVHFDLRLELLRRRERRALVALGVAAAEAEPPRDSRIRELYQQISGANLRIAELRKAIQSSIQADRTDYSAVSPLFRSVVMLRGLCARAILRHQRAAIENSLPPIHQRVATALLSRDAAGSRLPEHLVGAVLATQREIQLLAAERARRLAPFNGSALPRWLPHLRGEAKEFTRSVWLQLRPNVLPRLPALMGLAVGWWIADTYTTSHVKSVLHSLGIGNGGRKVVSGDTYRAMLFWLPILAAGFCAYLADRAKLLIHRRYVIPPEHP